jgi:hypothetical protein
MQSRAVASEPNETTMANLVPGTGFNEWYATTCKVPKWKVGSKQNASIEKKGSALPTACSVSRTAFCLLMMSLLR